VNLIWVGTDDGLIHVTHDGGARWRNVTPAGLTPWSKVSLMEASHFDTLAAYAAVNRFRLDDLRPHVYRTRDGGATWTEIVAGIPENEVVNVVREDPVRRGLLFAGTERSVYVSFDDGDHWQSLRLNLPASSMRDLWIHEADLVVGTHGRSAWILDDISPLRQMAEVAAAAEPFLVRPARATRVRWNMNTDTPLPIDEPAGQNPPDGAILDYVLPAAASGPVVLEVLDAAGRLMRRVASDDPAEPVDSSANIPLWWVRPEQRLGTAPGAHRYVWDLRTTPPAALSHNYPMTAIYRNTWREPRGPFVMPGTYTVRLTAGGRAVTQPLVVRMDPRVTTPVAVLAQQFALATRLTDAIRRDSVALADVRALRTRAGGAARSDSLAQLERGLARLSGQLVGVMDLVAEYDGAPTSQAVRTAVTFERTLADLLGRLAALKR
jgi:hypothetical protein